MRGRDRVYAREVSVKPSSVVVYDQSLEGGTLLPV